MPTNPIVDLVEAVNAIVGAERQRQAADYHRHHRGMAGQVARERDNAFVELRRLAGVALGLLGKRGEKRLNRLLLACESLQKWDKAPIRRTLQIDGDESKSIDDDSEEIVFNLIGEVKRALGAVQNLAQARGNDWRPVEVLAVRADENGPAVRHADENGKTLNQSGAGQGEEEAAKLEKLATLASADRKAYLAFEYVARQEGVTPDDLRDEQAHKFLVDTDFNDDKGDYGELTGYRPAKNFDSWRRRLSAARNALGEQKHKRSADRPHGPSIVRADHI